MDIVSLYKLIVNTRIFVKGQKVWEIEREKNGYILVLGKYKGDGRWIKGRIRIDKKPKPNARYIEDIELSHKFYLYLNLMKSWKKGDHYKFFNQPQKQVGDILPPVAH